MKNKILFLIIISAFTILAGASYALAQDSGTMLPPPQVGTTPGAYVNQVATTSENEQEKSADDEKQDLDQDTKNQIADLKAQMENIKQKIEALREGSKQKMEALKEKIENEKDKKKAKAKQAILIGREDALVRFDTAIQRAEELRTKVEKQVTKLESQGVVISDELKNMSINAASKLNDARSKVVEINNIFAKSINQLSKEDKTKIAALTKDTQGLIKEAQKLLNDEVFKIRKLINPKALPPVAPTTSTVPTTTTTEVPTPTTSTSTPNTTN